MKKLAREIATQQAAIEKLKKDQTRLENLVASIDKRLERERAAEEATARAEEAKRAAAAQKNQKPIAPLPSGSFAQSKGRLIRPVSGRVAAGFGSRRTGSAVWQGILFSAPEGAEVSACAAGRVVFSDWLRGYGNLLIIDHGGTYMSVYANNESVLKNVGDRSPQAKPFPPLAHLVRAMNPDSILRYVTRANPSTHSRGSPISEIQNFCGTPGISPRPFY